VVGRIGRLVGRVVVLAGLFRGHGTSCLSFSAWGLGSV
jgi:hypothetical protein